MHIVDEDYNIDINEEQDEDSSVHVDSDFVLEEEENVEEENLEEENLEEENLSLASAKFLLTLKEKFRLTQVALDYTIDSVMDIVKLTSHEIEQSVTRKLQSLNSSEISQTLSDCFVTVNPFDNLKTEYQQTQFYKEHLGLIEPITVELGRTYKYQQCGSTQKLVEVKDTFQYVPLLKNLEILFSNKQVFEEINKSHSRTDGLLGDFCDGSFLKNHSLFSNNTDGSLLLQFVIYYDELEVSNPLGSSRGKHKLSKSVSIN
jgi:hypothetical protein